MIEAKNEGQALVEEALGFGALGGDGVMNVAEAWHERGLTLGIHGVRVLGEGANR